MQEDIKAQAKNVKKILGEMGIDASLGQAQQLVARMGGFRSYQAARCCTSPAPQASPALLDLVMSTLDRMAQGEDPNAVIEDTGITARVSEARHEVRNTPYRDLALSLLGLFGKLEVSSAGGLWDLLYKEALSDAVEQELEWAKTVLSSSDLEEIAARWDVAIGDDNTLVSSASTIEESWDAVRKYLLRDEPDFHCDVEDGARVSYFVEKPDEVAKGFKVSDAMRTKFPVLRDAEIIWILRESVEVIFPKSQAARMDVVNGSIQKKTPLKCPQHPRFPGDVVGCGSTHLVGPDAEGLLECADCGMFFRPEQAQGTLREGEILGVDADGCLVYLNAEQGEAYNSGEPLAELDRKGLSSAERSRIAEAEKFMQQAREFASICWDALCRAHAEDLAEDYGADVEDLLLAGSAPEKLGDIEEFARSIGSLGKVVASDAYKRFAADQAFANAVYLAYVAVGKPSIKVFPIQASGGTKSISDDDLCSTCGRCEYAPGEMSSCGLDWPGLENADGYVQFCRRFQSKVSS